MLKLKLDNKEFTKFNSVDIDLNYDSIASTFSIDLFFDPNNPDHRKIIRPGAYPKAELFYENEKLLTGTILTPNLNRSSKPELVTVEGYSLPGILEDCPPPLDVYPLEQQGQSLKSIVEKFIKPFNIGLVIDPSVASKASKTYDKITAEETKSVKSFITELANQRNIVLTHDTNGNLVMTKTKTDQIPIGRFTDGQPTTNLSLDFDGQSMHSDITVMAQASDSGGNSSQATVKNPFVDSYRPRIEEQTSGDDLDAEEAAKNLLAEELSKIKLSADLDRWVINDRVIKPNRVIRVQSKRLFLDKETDFFIESVKLQGDSQPKTASINCVLPEVYSGNTPKNIFL